MIFLFLSIICSALIAIVFKFSERRDSNRYALTAFNYVTAAIISFILLPEKKLFNFEWFKAFSLESSKLISQGELFSPSASAAWAIILGCITGVIFFSSFYLYQYNVKKNGAALSATFAKLGVLIPVLLSIALFKELPSWLQLLGIVLAISAILLINLGGEKNALVKTKWELVFLFIIGGLGDFNSKVYQFYGIIEYKELFIFYIFVSALLISLIMLVIKRRGLTMLDMLFGILVGIPNQLTSYYLIKSLESIEASVAFPIYSAGTILMVNLVNILLFKEKLNKKQYVAIGIIVIALILLNL